MGSPVWFFIASLFLVSVTGKAFDNGAQSYYGLRVQESESSSPAPEPSTASGRKLAGMKELVLYLTPDQVQVLEAAGAVVKPFPEFEKAFVQPQYQQNVEEQTEPQVQTEAPKEEAKQDLELEEFYKVLNLQKIKEDAEEEEAQSDEQSTEKPRPKYKYTSKSRLQDYASLYVQKKANRGKPYSTEYVRYLPNYETENLKMESYRPKPVPGYSFDDSQETLDIARYLITEAPEIKKTKQNPQTPEETESDVEVPSRTLSKEPVRAQQQLESPVKYQSTMEDKGPVTFEGKVRESIKTRKSSKKQQPAKVWEPANVQEDENDSEELEPPSEDELIEKIRSLAREEDNKSKTSSEIERQFASLLAPLIQHKKITEAIAKEKEELAKNEKEIQNKLKELKEAENYDDEKYAIELRKLNENLEKQNVLAEKLAHQGVPKQSAPKVSKKEEKQEDEQEEAQEEAQEEEQEEEEEEKQEEEQEEEQQNQQNRRQPTESKKNNKVNDPTPVVIRLPDSLNRPQFYPVTLDYLRSLSIPVPKSKKVEEQKPVPVQKRIRVPETGNVYFKFDKPYLVHQPDKLSIVRHIWEH